MNKEDRENITKELLEGSKLIFLILLFVCGSLVGCGLGAMSSAATLQRCDIQSKRLYNECCMSVPQLNISYFNYSYSP